MAKTARRAAGLDRGAIALWLGPLFFVAVLFYWPVVRLVALGLADDGKSGAGGVTKTLAAVETWQALWFTAGLAAAAAAVCLLLGVPMAYLLYRKSFAGVRLVRSLIVVPFVLPVIVVAIGFTAFRNWNVFFSDSESYGVFGISPLGWIISAQVFINLSLVVRSVGSQWLTLDSATEEAAALDGAGRLRTIWSVTLPQLAGSLWSSAALVFLYCASSFGIIMVLGGGLVHTLETEVYTAAVSFLDLPKAATLAMLQVLLTAVAFGFASWRGGNLSLAVDEEPAQSRQARIDRRDLPVVALALLVVAPLLLIPVGLVVSQAFVRLGKFTLQNFADLGTLGNRDLLDIPVFDAVLNSLRNAAISTSVAVLIGVLVSYLLWRARPGLTRRVLDLAFLLPMGISMVVVGFGYLITFSGDPLPLRSSWLVTPIAQTLVALPLVIRLVYPALTNLDREVIEAATMDAATPTQVWWQVQVPLIRPALQTAIGYAAVVSIGEFGAASFLAYGDQATLPTVLYRLIARPGAQNYGMAMAMSAILIAITFAVVLLTQMRRARD